MTISATYRRLFRIGFTALPALILSGVPAYAQVQSPMTAPAPVTAPIASEIKPTAQGQLTLSQVLRMAYLNNPSLNSGRADLLATEEFLPQAQAGWKPSVSADADVTSTNSDSSPDGTSEAVGLSLTQPLYRGGRTVAQSASARFAIEARAQLLRAQEQDIFESAAISYMDVLRDEALLDLRTQNQDLLSRQLKATRDRFEVGELTKTDVSQSDARLAGAQADAIDARGNLNSSRATFEKVIGIRPDSLAAPDVKLDLPESLDEVVTQAEEASPLVLSAASAHQSSEKDIDTIFGELMPQIGLFGGVDQTYDPPAGTRDERTDGSIGIEASIPLYEAGSVRSRVRQAKHTANSRYLDILDIKRQVREEAVRNWEDLQAARAQIRSRQAQVEASRIAQEGVRQEAEFGARSVLDALDADQELLDAEVALVSARRDEVVARFSLMATLGLLSPEALGFGGETINTGDHLEKIQRKVFDMDVDRVGQPG